MERCRDAVHRASKIMRKQRGSRVTCCFCPFLYFTRGLFVRLVHTHGSFSAPISARKGPVPCGSFSAETICPRHFVVLTGARRYWIFYFSRALISLSGFSLVAILGGARSLFIPVCKGV